MMFVDSDRLHNLIEKPDDGFDLVFRHLSSVVKEDLRPLLVYLDKVLNYLLVREAERIRCTQVHLPKLREEGRQVLLEFIAVKTFYQSLGRDVQQDSYASEQFRHLQRVLERNEAPADAKAANGGNAAYRQWQEEKRRWAADATFLRNIAAAGKSLYPDTILNIPSSYWHVLEESRHATTLEELETGKKRSYCLLNDSLSLTDLLGRLHALGRLEPLRQVIMFDSDRKRLFSGYEKDSLIRCSDRMPMKDLVIISFERRPFRLSSVINRMQRIYRIYFRTIEQRIHFSDSYVIRQEEAEQLLKEPDGALSVKWVGRYSELFADYLDLVNGYEVEELGRIAVLNIFSGAINKSVAGVLLKDLFRTGGREGIFPEAAQLAVKKLLPQELSGLEALAAQVLEVVIQGWDSIRAAMQEQPKQGAIGVVVAPALKDLSVFRRELRQIIPDIKVEFYTWRDIRDGNCKEKLIFILAYRGYGHYPFALYPSLFELGDEKGSKYRPMLLTAFFAQRYASSRYYYYSRLNELLKNNYRYAYLNWKAVDERINVMKPDQLEVTVAVEEEDDEELSDAADNIRVDFADGSHGSYSPSRLLLVRSEPEGRLEVMRLDELAAESEGWLAQPLDELYEEMNPFQIRPDEEEELALIKRRYGVVDPNQVLWKVLLARKLGEGQGSAQLYEDLAELFGKKEFVKYGYFNDHWLDIHSKILTPRRRKHFRLLCQYLGLEGAYIRLKLKKRASMHANSRESRARMNSLLSQMILEGLFEKGVKWPDRPLIHLLEGHELEEVGITAENLNTELEALVGLLTDKIHLKRIQKIERS